MAIFRKVHTSIWSDSFFSELDKDKKLFYLYLLTNERTKQCGVYEITKRQIAFDLGYSIDRVSILLEYFISKKKVKYNEDTCEIGLANWLKYNSSTSPKVQSCINKEFGEVKDTLLIEYVKGIYTESQEEKEEEQKQEQKQEEEQKPDTDLNNDSEAELEIWPTFEDFWTAYNKKVGAKEKCKKKFDKLKQDTKEIIMNHIFIYVKATPDKQYRLNPETFFNQKAWENEIINKNGTGQKGFTERVGQYFDATNPDYKDL